MSKIVLVESEETKSNLRASGNRVTRIRVMRGLGVDISLINIELSLNYIGNSILKIRVSTLINIDLSLNNS